MVPVAIIALSLAALFCRREKRKSLFVMMVRRSYWEFLSRLLTIITDTHGCHFGEYHQNHVSNVPVAEQ